MSYNLLNYISTDNSRDTDYQVVIGSVNPDILVVQEITSQAAVNNVLNNILNVVSPGSYAAAAFNDGPDSDNALFYRSSLFTFVGNKPISTALRDINEFTLVHKTLYDTLRIYSVHLKASSGTDNEVKRAAEVDSLRAVTNALPDGSHFIVVGDFNIYKSGEAAYQKLVQDDPGNDGHFVDPITMTGTWNNASYAAYHTQSPRIRSFGGGATGGLDDRFDLMLYSRAISESGGITYVTGSCTPYGNDGNHYNDSINAMPNNAVSQAVANALHNASDHLPVYSSFVFESALPVEITSVSASAAGLTARLRWSTATETQNFGFEIERRPISNLQSSFDNLQWTRVGFVEGGGTTTSVRQYHYEDTVPAPGRYAYRIKQIDVDGSFRYVGTVEIETGVVPRRLNLRQNYPNPFNPTTTIEFALPQSGRASLKIYDSAGKEIALLFDGFADAGRNYSVPFDASGLPSGIYVCRLSAGGAQALRKMTYLK